ncbi:6-pyruvoyltetrahydropterin/6-carboxytetrahydropterin synthase [uncultured Gammaproteobacteria bacterium]
MTYSVTRSLAIDAGHRIMTHGSKCRHLHGHRYTIEATAATAALHTSGEQQDMVIDFSFLKQELLAEIDQPCDHGLICSLADLALLEMLCPPTQEFPAWHRTVEQRVAREGYLATCEGRLGQKLYVVPFQPTAECLARHWFTRLAPRVEARSDGYARLCRVVVWETPNCAASFEPND